MKTLREGWLYIAVFALLIFLMVAFRWEKTAPFYAVTLLLLVNQFNKNDRVSFEGFLNIIVSVGRTLSELVAVLLGIGMIVGAFQATGLTGPLANGLVHMAGNSMPMLLIMGAVTSFIFGMGMTVTACYIFLAVVLAPALVQAGLNELAVHLFILYWGMVSFITPPVALGAFAIYVIPFFFVLNPALIGQGPPMEVLVVLVCALIGVWFISAALQGFVSFVGPLNSTGISAVMRLLLFLAGLMVAAPVGGIAGLSHFALTLFGIAIAMPPLAVAWRAGQEPETATT